jgi:hypothetical protein
MIKAKVITSPKKFKIHDTDSIVKNKKTVFLAGGISNCTDWQSELIELLLPFDITIFNPRRKFYDMADKNIEREQITWEFNAINTAEIFSIWFQASESVQPISLYELGSNIHKKTIYRTIIGIEPGYKRETDVRIQMELICPTLSDSISNTLESHAVNILKALNL